MLAWFYWNPPRTIITLPFFHLSIHWYSLCFAIGFIGGYLLFRSLFTRFLLSDPAFVQKEAYDRAKFVTDQVLFYMVLATIIGARLGHLIFYEQPSYYLKNPLIIFQIWKGGLASHGAVIAIIIALVLLSNKLRKKYPPISFLRLLDFVAMPTAFAAVFIRIGNFINQEVIGVQTTLLWAVVFGRPFDGSAVLPRHPAQLYEAVCYLITFFILFKLSYRPSFFMRKGKMIGLFFVLVFGSRFLIEFIKLKQSYIAHFTWLNMGQILSLPLIIFGLYLFLYKAKSIYVNNLEAFK